MPVTITFLGEQLNIDEVEHIFELDDAVKWYKGEIRKYSKNEVNTASSIRFCVSEASFDDFESQKQDAIAWLNLYKKEMKAVSHSKGLEQVYLDFGIALRNAVAQSNEIPAKLVKIAGEFGIGIILSQYETSNNPCKL